MNRDAMMARVRDCAARSEPWDVIIVGGGATGLGAAVESATRGYKTLLLEQSDFAKGTSSRSTKLVHGGVRYLRQGNVSLVIEALRERGRLRHNAPHLVRNLSFVVPNYDWWEGKMGLGPSRNLSLEQTIESIPTVEPDGLRGGVIYYDAQFDDARLAITLARTAADHEAAMVNYARVTGLLKADDSEGGLVRGVRFEDVETGDVQEALGRVVVNATGVFTDGLRQMDDPDAGTIIAPSQGIHVVLDKRFLPGDSAIMVPDTDDGRVLFAIPWHDRVVVGTTDTPVPEASLEPRPLADEIEFVMSHAARYLTEDPTDEDVLSMFAGLRPLVRPAKDGGSTSSVSRDHMLAVSRSGLVTITGGKWTTYRKMGEDTIDQAALVGGLDERPCITRDLRLHGWIEDEPDRTRFAVYGADTENVDALAASEPGLGAPLHPRLELRGADVIWAARHEMARTVEDVLSRRNRALLLDARASIEVAPKVADLLASALGRDAAWAGQQVAIYTELANGYILRR
jgi:glycerol-3-phosphate dehydrogenase